jgi:hypothetical protein
VSRDDAIDSPDNVSLQEILRHVAERPQDHSIIKVPEVGITTARERNCPAMSLVTGHRSSAADGVALVRAFDRLSRRQTAVLKTHEWQCHEVHHGQTSRLDH